MTLILVSCRLWWALKLLREFLPTGARNDCQTYIWLYIPFQTTKTHARWIIVIYSQGLNFFSHFSDSLLTCVKISECFSANWSNKNKIAPTHILWGCPFLSNKISRRFIFLMHFPWLNFTQLTVTDFGQFVGYLLTFFFHS
jgi:hypothetical protein